MGGVCEVIAGRPIECSGPKDSGIEKVETRHGSIEPLVDKRMSAFGPSSASEISDQMTVFLHTCDGNPQDSANEEAPGEDGIKLEHVSDPEGLIVSFTNDKRTKREE